MPNKKINELSPRTPSLTDLIIVGDPSTGYSYKATISVLTAFAGSNIQFSSLGGISLTSPANGQVLQFNGTSWVNYTPTTWNTAYDRSLVSAAVSGSTTKTLTLTKQDGSTLTATWSDLNTDAVTSVFGRTGAVVATEGDYNLDLLSDVTLSTPTTNQVLQYNGTAWVNATFVAGINSLNGLTATTQTFATGTSGTDFGISSTTSTHTFNLPTASATNRGALSSADWTTFNSKVGGSGTTNYLSKWTSSSALGNSLVFDNGTNVGIGTTSPLNRFHTNGGALTVNSETTYAGRFSNNSTKSVVIGYDDANNRGHIGSVNPATGWTDLVLNANGGNVGVGISAPTFKMHIVSGTNGLLVTNGVNSSLEVYTKSNELQLNSGGTAPFCFATGATPTERMRIANSTGNVLIGTTTDAGFRLDVSGTARVTGNATIGGFLFSTNGSFSIGIQSNVPAGVGSLQDVVFIGRNTGEQNTGWRNTALGSVSFRYNRTGEDNVAIGHAAVSNGGFNVRRDFNTGVGSYSLYLSDGNYNSAFGFRAGYGITTGIYNTIIGAQDNAHTGNGITTGSYNTIIGSGITGLSSSLANHTIIADGQGNMRLVAFNDGNVFIGGSTSLPTNAGYKLDVNGTARVQNNVDVVRTGNTSVFVNIINQSSGSSVEAGVQLISNGGRLLLGKYSTTTTSYKILASGDSYIVNQAGASAGDISILNDNTTGAIKFGAGGTSTTQMILTSGGSVGIGTTTPNASALLDVSSTTKGFLPPRMTGLNAEAIASAAAGLLVYINNGNGTTITSTGWWGYDGTTWVKLN